MSDKHLLFGAEFSLYTGKARSYLRYKRIPFDEVLSSLSVYRKTIVPRTGVRFVPVVKTPDDRYLQDTSHIIDTLEGTFGERPVLPNGPRQRLASLLLEVHGDEWLLIPAMHYRWNHDNFPFVFEEFGRTLFPGWPGFIQRAMGKRIAAKFRGYLPVLGITEVNHDAIENWYEADFLVTLERHFAEHNYLFGDCPTIGDFGLFGPLYAHLYRDPYPGMLMRKLAPNVAAWVERMIQAEQCDGALLADDAVPATLTPIFKRLFEEHWPVLTDTALRLERWVEANEGSALPRRIGEHQFSINGITETRAVLPYSIWKMQRPLDCYRSLSASDKLRADAFLQQVGGLSALNFRPPVKLIRENNKFKVSTQGQ